MTVANKTTELAIWYDANDCVDPILSCKSQIDEVMANFCHARDVTLQVVSYEVLKPGDLRVPVVPRWLGQVKDVVPRLLVATASMHEKTVLRPESGIVDDLDRKDLKRLRVITRRKHQQAYPNTAQLTNEECDRLIDRFGMEVVMEQLRGSTIH